MSLFTDYLLNKALKDAGMTVIKNVPYAQFAVVTIGLLEKKIESDMQEHRNNTRDSEGCPHIGIVARGANTSSVGALNHLKKRNGVVWLSHDRNVTWYWHPQANYRIKNLKEGLAIVNGKISKVTHASSWYKKTHACNLCISNMRAKSGR